MYPAHLNKLIALLRRLPGVGPRTAERYAFELLSQTPQQLTELSDVIAQLPSHLQLCDSCGALVDGTYCRYCDPTMRNGAQLSIVATHRDLFALESTGEYRGLYHVTGGLISPLEGRMPEDLRLDSLWDRLERGGVKEVIIALDSTVDGDATAYYLKSELATFGVRLSRLAFGLPIGSSLEYVDEGTLARALQGRAAF